MGLCLAVVLILCHPGIHVPLCFVLFPVPGPSVFLFFGFFLPMSCLRQCTERDDALSPWVSGNVLTSRVVSAWPQNCGGGRFTRSFEIVALCLLVLPRNLRKKHFSSWLLKLTTFPHSWQLLCSKNLRVMCPHMSGFADSADSSSLSWKPMPLSAEAFSSWVSFVIFFFCPLASLQHRSPAW